MEINRSALLPNLLTIGNGICGFAALVQLGKVGLLEDGTLANTEHFKNAAYLVLLGMVFDVFDGKIARLSKGDSQLGAQLDSFCDLLTFGIVPAVMVLRLNIGLELLWQKFVWFFCLAYFLGALLRLARFNVENTPDESAHLAFKGLPTPAAAGCIASLVIFQRYIVDFRTRELLFLQKLDLFDVVALQGFVEHYLTVILPCLCLLLGFTMVSSRLRFDHIGSKLLRRQSFDSLAYLIFGAVLLAMAPEIVLPIAFLGYLVWTPVLTALQYFWPALKRSVSDADV
ncbi:MAG: CDP-alcohol phosphatidyltransferase family protein [Planctomycetes bacterium]|nr:CDP-alcohol phosphatidyltransferase family protein [Planctomycetota bacterium]